jgi:phosphatidylserine/phosphatidylglycerophosphate/cardiolipin synthase-like enzyme
MYEWQPSTLHAKPFVIDGDRSMALNYESTLMVWDRAVGQQMDEMFFDDLRDAEEITLPRLL